MKTLIVYDSFYGNTNKVADAIAAIFGEDGQLVHVSQVDYDSLKDVDTLVVGSPTHGGAPSQSIQTFLSRLPAPGSPSAKAVAFYTRLTWKFLEKHGGAAEKIAEALREKGWRMHLSPEGFLVGGLRRGPLKNGELERATLWAKQIKGNC
jgi:flavodoxin I